jgi:hypothetical protein
MKDKSVIKFQLLKHKDIKKFHNFIENHLSHKHIFAHDTNLINWQHKGVDSYHCMAAFKNSTLIGVQGVIPQCQFDPALPRNQFFLALWRVDETQGIGIGIRLYECILSEYKPDFIGSIGLTNDMINFHKWKGFTVGVLNHHVILSPYITNFKIAIVPSNIKKNINFDKISVNSTHSFKKINIEELNTLNTDTIYSHQTPPKSDFFIINRYLEHPTYHYDLRALIDREGVVSIFIFRPVQVNDSIVLRLVDFIGVNDSFLEIYNHLLCMLKEYKAEYIDLYSYGISLDILKESGFLDRHKVKDLVIPNHFEPFNRKNIELNYAYKYSGKGRPVRIFKGDGDQDRPN